MNPYRLRPAALRPDLLTVGLVFALLSAAPLTWAQSSSNELSAYTDAVAHVQPNDRLALLERFAMHAQPRPLKIDAEGSSSLDTISGITAEKTGALNENPVPIRNIEPRMTYGVRRFNQPRMASPPAHTASQMYPTCSIFLRSVRSARAPAGRINRKNGSVAAVDIRERSIVE